MSLFSVIYFLIKEQIQMNIPATQLVSTTSSSSPSVAVSTPPQQQESSAPSTILKLPISMVNIKIAL